VGTKAYEYLRRKEKKKSNPFYREKGLLMLGVKSYHSDRNNRCYKRSRFKRYMVIWKWENFQIRCQYILCISAWI